jgi:hypothetical protein
VPEPEAGPSAERSPPSQADQPTVLVRPDEPAVAEAQALIENMIQQGASVSASEEQALIAYFTR